MAGSSYGHCCSRLSTNTFMLPMIIGRVPPSDFIVKDSEVSGKHAQINWNMNVSIISQLFVHLFIVFLWCVRATLVDHYRNERSVKKNPG